jgi:ATP-dependent Clp protease ATP-binding subunit ClpC
MLTSNIGAEELKKEINPGFGLASFNPVPTPSAGRMSSVGSGSAKKRFPPEFMNRIDCIITYNPLTQNDIDEILDIEVEKIEKHIKDNLESNAFTISMTSAARAHIVNSGFSKEYGARNLKRVLHKEVLFPLASMYNAKEIAGGDVAHFSLREGKLDIEVI